MNQYKIAELTLNNISWNSRIKEKWSLLSTHLRVINLHYDSSTSHLFGEVEGK